MTAAKVMRAAVVNVLFPVTIAWATVAYFDQRKYGSLAHLYARQTHSYGPISVTVRLADTESRNPEPIVASGVLGKAAIIYIRILKNSRATVGAEFLGLGAYESEPFPLSFPDGPITLMCYLPEFYPADGALAWGATPAIRQTLLRHQYLIKVDGVERLKGVVNYGQVENGPTYYGSNPLGGTLVTRTFSGQILDIPESRQRN